VVDDAALVLTELCTNATLHSGASYFHVSVHATPQREVCVSVSDDGPVPAAAVARRSEGLHTRTERSIRSELTTGRGLAIIDELAVDWGVTAEASGKQVWAQLSGGQPGEASRSVPTPRAEQSEEAQRGSLPPGWTVVQLRECPVRLGLAQDDHLDELIRELQLIAGQSEQPPQLGALIRELLDGQASARRMGRHTAQEAAAAGLEHVTVEMLLPDRAAQEIERLHEAVSAADALCDSQELLTLASDPEVRQLRAWMRDEIRDQIRGIRSPQTYESWVGSAARA
jgi:hypothetical protein